MRSTALFRACAFAGLLAAFAGGPLSVPARASDLNQRGAAAALSVEERARVHAIEIGLASTVAVLPVQGSPIRGGSGFVFDGQGHVVTNAHVVGAADRVRIQTRDGRIVFARVIGRDGRSDIAVLEPEEPLGLQPLRFAESIPLIGQTVFALGNPMGFQFSASRGIVSAHGRYYDVNWPVAMLQHDAALNPGNSGGPLIDQSGRVIGMNTATPPATMFDIGIGLALPAPVVQEVASTLIRGGFVRRGALGVQVSAADEAVAEALGASGRRGLLIDVLAPGGAAERAGLHAGDLILSIDEAPVRFARDILQLTMASRPGDAVVVEFARRGEIRRLVVHLGQDRPDGGLRRGTIVSEAVARETSDVGLVFSGQAGSGVELGEVRADSAADREGLRRGDVVLAIGGRVVATVAEAQEAVRAATGDLLVLRVERPGREVRHVVLPRSDRAAAARQIGDPDGQPSGPI